MIGDSFKDAFHIGQTEINYGGLYALYHLVLFISS